MTAFSERIHEALDFAATHHAGQMRKDADIKIPYISHLFAVAYILAQFDFPEDVVVAGVLHDFLEDVVEREWKPKLETELAERFGESVHTLIRLVTQQKRDSRGKRIDWHTRAELYRRTICDPNTPNEARAISCADKIHNIESLLMALRRSQGREQRMWRRLNATPADQMEKFELLHAGIAKCWEHPIVEELGRKVEELAVVVRQFRE